MGKAALVLKYLQDHARAVCKRRSDEDGEGTWKIVPIPEPMRRNIVLHFGPTFDENIPSPQNQQTMKQTPIETPLQTDWKQIEKNEAVQYGFHRKKKKVVKRLSLSRPRTTAGIFSRGIKGLNNSLDLNQTSLKNLGKTKGICNENACLMASPKEENTPSTSSIYLDDQCVSSDYEHELFQEPVDLEMAGFHHHQDLFRNGTISSNFHNEPSAVNWQWSLGQGDDWNMPEYSKHNYNQSRFFNSQPNVSSNHSRDNFTK